MQDLPTSARRFVIVVIAAGTLALGVSLTLGKWQDASVFALAIFAFFALLFHVYGVEVADHESHHIVVSPAAAWLLAASFIFQPWQALVVAMVAGAGADILRRRVWYKVAFNGAHFGLEALAASTVFTVLSSAVPPPVGIPLAGVVGGLSYYVLNTTAVNTVFALVSQQSPLYTWRTSYQDVLIHNVATISVAGLIVILWKAAPPSVVLAAVPLMTVRLAIDHLTRLKTQTRQALLGIANILDRRDPSTHQHSDRVAAYARLLADELGLPADQVALIYDTTRLHDIGKIGMSNELLFKPGELTEEDWKKFRQHPAIGAEIVASFPLFKGAREIILHHQEKYDGSGYPEGLEGDQIPLGSRIIAVADAYDAMRSERPYREALPSDRIVSELVQGKGTQFDPEMVDAFLLALVKKGEIPQELLPVELAEPREEPILHPSGAS